ncbi:MAG TPA: efflux RND transporter periplasmic adaptor subunit [Nitrospiria bacterium]|nr:efflux RND transporter periplasmic adaptor subunit [Nitrospiria bacterium]
MSYPTLRMWLSLLCLIGGVLVAGCKKDTSRSGMMAFPPPEVTIAEIQKKTVAVTYEYVGQIAGSREVEVRPRVSGILMRRNYKEGSKVEAGQSLFTIDPEPFRLALEKAEAQMASARASHDQAFRNMSRLKPLWEARAVSQKDYDDTVSSELISAANEKLSEAAVNEANLNLTYTRVEAPISGVTSEARKSEGTLVQAQQTLLMTISQIDPIYVIFSFTEAEHLKFNRDVSEGKLRLPKGGKFDVKLTLEDGSEYPRIGKVDFTDVRVDSTTGTIVARGVVANPEIILRPGQFVKVKLIGAIRPDALTVPQRAVLEGPGGKMVMTVNAQGIAEMHSVQAGDWLGEEWVILSGLNAGDQVIVDGVVKARPGSPVKIAPSAAEAPKAASGPEQSPNPGSH